MTRLRADALLLLAALIWGTAFVAQKLGNEHMTPVMFCGARFFLAMLAVAPLAWRESKQQTQRIDRKDLWLAVLIGLSLFFGISMQQIALITTSATNAGFLTALYMVMVPFAAWMMQGIRPRPLVLLACTVCLAGAWLLAGRGVGQGWAFGDVLILIADVIWAFQMTLISKFLAHTHRPFFLSVVQYGVTGVLGIVAGLAFEPVVWSGIRTALPAILYAGLLSGGIAYTLQIVAQRYTPAAEAALILSLEGVFAAVAGAMLLGERLTFLASIGCVLILFGILLVEIGPLARRR
jgi:drug/metabolite transporter (DMT)-like permease